MRRTIITVRPSRYPLVKRFQVESQLCTTGSDWINRRNAQSRHPITDSNGIELCTTGRSVATALFELDEIAFIQLTPNGVRVMLKLSCSWHSVQDKIARVLATQLNWPEYELMTFSTHTPHQRTSSPARFSTS